MTSIGRRLRAVLSIGLTWAVPWGLIGASVSGLAVFLLLRLPPGLPRMRVAVSAALSGGLVSSIMGFIIGSAFGLTLIAAERNRRLSSLTAPRFAILGTLVGAGMSGGLAILSEGTLSISGAGLFVGTCSVLGGASAAASLILAKRDTGDDESDPILAVGGIDFPALPPDGPVSSSVMGGALKDRASVRR